MVSPPTVGASRMCRIEPERRRGQEGDVGVPPRGPVLTPVDGEHLGVALDGGDHGVGRRHLAELAGEVGLHLGAQVLVGEEQHQVSAQRGPHLGHHVVARAGGTGRGPRTSAPMLGEIALMSRPVATSTRSIVPQRSTAATTRPVPGAARPTPHIVCAPAEQPAAPRRPLRPEIDAATRRGDDGEFGSARHSGGRGGGSGGGRPGVQVGRRCWWRRRRGRRRLRHHGDASKSRRGRARQRASRHRRAAVWAGAERRGRRPGIHEQPRGERHSDQRRVPVSNLTIAGVELRLRRRHRVRRPEGRHPHLRERHQRRRAASTAARSTP